MSKDVVPELMKSIEKAFEIHTANDKRLARVLTRVRDGTATQMDGHTYALCIGRDSSQALQDVLTERNLPDGQLYYNIATRTVVPTLENNQMLINDVAAEIQAALDARADIGLKTVKPGFPVRRVSDLIDKMTVDGISLADALIWIREPIVNNSEAFYDDFIKENAKFRSKAGMKTTLTRIAEAKCCEWCAALAGTYEYGSAPDDIYRRHEFCRCTVTYQSKKISQNAWSKKQWQSTPEELERRENTMPSIKSKYERQETLARLERDREIKRIMAATGYTRRTSREIARQSPEKIAADIERAKKLKRR